jgi:hypothetical protein
MLKNNQENIDFNPITRRHIMKTWFGSNVILAVVVLLSAPLTAQIQDRVQLHGFGGWAGGHTNNDNEFASMANKETPLTNYYFALNVSAQLEQNVSIFAQPCWQSSLAGKEVVLDYVFAQWMLAPQFGVRAGNIKNPIGIYSEVLNVGTLRPFYLVPQGRYVGATPAYTGMGFIGTIGAGPLEISYHMFGGELNYQMMVIEQPFGVDPITMLPKFQSFHLYLEGHNLVGGSLMLRTPISGFMIGGSVTSSNLYYRLEGGTKIKGGNKRTKTYAGQAEYTTERFLFRAEYWSMDDPNSKINNGFVEAAYKFTSHWQAALEYDWVLFKIYSIDETLNKHKAVGAGLDYWVNSDFVFKLNHYWVNGNNLAKPVNNAAQSAILGTLKRKTNLLIFGMQFSF